MPRPSLAIVSNIDANLVLDIECDEKSELLGGIQQVLNTSSRASFLVGIVYQPPTTNNCKQYKQVCIV